LHIWVYPAKLFLNARLGLIPFECIDIQESRSLPYPNIITAAAYELQHDDMIQYGSRYKRLKKENDRHMHILAFGAWTNLMGWMECIWFVCLLEA